MPNRWRAVVFTAVPSFLLSFAVVSLLLSGPSWEEEWKREIDALVASGAEVEPAAFAPPPVPGQDDGAPLYGKAFAGLDRLGKEKDFDVESLWDRPVDPKFLADYVDHYRPALPALRRAREKPRCRFPVDYGKGMEAEPVDPAFLRAARVLYGAASLAIRRGRDDEAAEYLLDLLALYHGIKDQPILISKAVAYAVLAMAFEVLEKDRPSFSRADWARVGDAFDAGDLHARYVRAVEYERAVGIDLVETEGRSLRGFKPPANVPPDEMGTFWKRAGTHHVRIMNDFVTLSRLPFHRIGGAYKSLVRSLEDRAAKEPLDVALAVLLVPALDRFHENLAGAKARVRIARAVCRIKAEGGIPEALDVEDPFTGKPMIYRREGGGFHLYSLGPNGVDDGGEGEDAGFPKDDVGIRGAE